MGEAKRRQYSGEAFLLSNPECVYCGSIATTTDHCPPRCFFLGRQWPETFEYPSCAKCNTAARLDDQAVAMLTRVRIDMKYEPSAMEEFRRLVKGVANNQPALVQEWGLGSASARKREFRAMFGRTEGDELRHRGWGMMNIGPITEALISRFMIRLGQSMYYNQFGTTFQGTLFTRHVSLLQLPDADAFLTAALSIAPIAGAIERAGKSLNSQFLYRYNVNRDDNIFYAVVQCSEQFVFMLTAMGTEMSQRLATERWQEEALGQLTEIRFDSSQGTPI